MNKTLKRFSINKFRLTISNHWINKLKLKLQKRLKNLSKNKPKLLINKTNLKPY